MKKLLICISLLSSMLVRAQTNSGDELDKLMGDQESTKKEYVLNAFKSSRVINGHSIEMLGEGVLDFRILHRFGIVKNGVQDFFGLDQASMRMGFDYGINKNLTIGIGRSTQLKEYDGFIKYRLLHQQKGPRPMPVSVVLVSGMTVKTVPFGNPVFDNFTNRLGYYYQIIVGRKFNNTFTLQLAPTLVHRNLVELNTDKNEMVALGIGGRFKMSNRTALILDTHPILYGARSGYNRFPLSIGVDIETGGHVFQLHFTNARGMNEKAFISETYQDWGKGEFQFGFNLSRVFQVKKNTASSW